jgi:hypothetical protein
VGLAVAAAHGFHVIAMNNTSKDTDHVRGVFRCSPQYRKALAAAAARQGLSVSCYLRAAVAALVAGPSGDGLSDEDRLALLMRPANPRAFSQVLNAKAVAAAQ